MLLVVLGLGAACCCLLLQAWEQAGQSIDWCRDIGLDGRSMRFARDIRQQLERILGPDGSGFDGSGGGERRRRQGWEPRQEGQGEGQREGGAAASTGGAAPRRDEQPPAEGRDRDRDRDGGSGDKRPREWQKQQQGSGGGGKRRRRGFSDAATVTALRMALTIGGSARPLLDLAAAALGCAAICASFFGQPATIECAALIFLPHVPAAPLPGFANRLARRMPMHNGYRTLGETSSLAQASGSSIGAAASRKP
jgi:ATP-dependent RNA helicase DHX8/PRP22